MTTMPRDTTSARAADALVDEKRRVGALFDRIAPRYDALNRILSFGMDPSWRKAALRHLPSPPTSTSASGLRVLDVATGTADVVLELLQRDDVAHVTGCDVSDEMLARGRDKLAAHPRTGDATLVRGDACALPFDDARFDVVTMAFGLRNVPDLSSCLRELRRVLVPGGRLIVLEFSTPRPGLFAATYELYRAHVLPRIGALVSGDARAYRYLDESIAAFPPPDALVQRVRDAGFDHALHEPLVSGAVGITVGMRDAGARA